MADALVSDTSVRKDVRVQVPRRVRGEVVTTEAHRVHYPAESGADAEPGEGALALGVVPGGGAPDPEWSGRIVRPSAPASKAGTGVHRVRRGFKSHPLRNGLHGRGRLKVSALWRSMETSRCPNNSQLGSAPETEIERHPTPGGSSRQVATATVLKTDWVSNPVGVRPSYPPLSPRGAPSRSVPRSVGRVPTQGVLARLAEW